jgi:hypothetical protein
MEATMDRLFAITGSLLALGGCAATIGEDDGTRRTGAGDSDFALMSSTGEEGVLRTGDALNLRVRALSELDPETMYRFEVTGPGGALLSRGDVRTDRTGGVFLATVLHDVGEDDRVAAGSTLDVSLLDAFGELRAATAIQLAGVPSLQRPGFNVNEPQPPHIFASSADGAPSNAFAVGGQDPGELAGPVHIAGDGFPEDVAGRTVDVYVAIDRDEWRGAPMPIAGDADWIAGPIAVAIDEEGRMAPTAVFTPAVNQVGIYDLLVDVDGDGLFEWSFNAKDGADGLGRVGFTVQYSAAWLRDRAERHVLVNIAYNSHERDTGVWQNTFRADEPVFMYLNPPVMHEYHFEVTKWIVRHQDFDAFWNNPAIVNEEGEVCFAELAVSSMTDTPERGCTNANATCFGVVPLGGETSASFDVVWDRDGDGCYQPGDDLLDVVGGDTGGSLVTLEQFRALSTAQQRGFTVQAF